MSECEHKDKEFVRYLPFFVGRIGMVLKCKKCKKKEIVYEDKTKN